MAPLSAYRTMQLQPVGPAPVAAHADAGSTLPRPTASAARDQEARLRDIVESHIDFVARVLRNAGSPSAEIDDDVQRTFIIAARKLEDVRPGAEKSFILRVALNVAAHARRTLARRREVTVEPTLEMADAAASPEQIADRKQARQMLDRILQGMHADLRTVFVLFEVEEMSMIEIAAALGIPQGTVASRLRRARAEFRARTDALRGHPGSGSQP